MYRIADNEKCIDYTKKGLATYADTSYETSYWRIRYLNTVGQAYKQFGQLDSAMAWYQQSMQVAHKLNEPVWMMINSVFIEEDWLLKKDYSKAAASLQHIYKLDWK